MRPADAAAETGVWRLFAAIAAAEPGRVFARFDGVPLTFAMLDRRSAAIAAGLARLGARRGDRVAVMARNSADIVALIFGLARAGLVWVPVNAQGRGGPLRHVLTHAEPAILVADAALMPVIDESGAALPGVPRVVASGEGGTTLAGLAETRAAHDAPPPEPHELFAIMYTSGTTGPAKGVMVTHRMFRLAGEGARLVSAAEDGDVLFVWEPLYHIGGAQLLVVPLLRRVCLAMVGRFSASRFWQEVKEEGATHIHFLGGILQILLKQPPGPLDRSHGARIAWGGGCPPDVWRPFEERFGLPIRECYGMTEASSFTTCNDRGIVGTVGRALPWLEVTVRDEAGTVLPPGRRGEIVVAAHDPGALTPGYFRNPEATSKALRDGLLFTGDAGTLDADGVLTFHGRLSDSVRVRGENVSAWEVEHVAAQHPAVEECAMIGVAAEVGEQEIKLFVRPREGCTLDLAGLSAWLGARLAPYQNPRYLALVDGFERTPSERIMKHRLPATTTGCFDRKQERRA